MLDDLIVGLDLAVGLWMIGGREEFLDTELFTKTHETFFCFRIFLSYIL